MAMFSEVGTPSRPFCRWDLSAMVEVTRKRCYVQAVRKKPRLIEMSVRVVIAPLVQLDPFGEVNYLRPRSWYSMNQAHPITHSEAEALNLCSLYLLAAGTLVFT